MIIEILFAILFAYVGWRGLEWMSGGNFLPSLPARKPKSLPIDYDYIAQQDKEIFGIESSGESVREFPEYNWKIYKDHVGDIKISIVDSSGKMVKYGWVLMDHVSENGVEAAIEKKMRRLVDEFATERRQAVTIDNVMKKYNGKAVEL